MLSSKPFIQTIVKLMVHRSSCKCPKSIITGPKMTLIMSQVRFVMVTLLFDKDGDVSFISCWTNRFHWDITTADIKLQHCPEEKKHNQPQNCCQVVLLALIPWQSEAALTSTTTIRCNTFHRHDKTLVIALNNWTKLSEALTFHSRVSWLPWVFALNNKVY